MKNIILLLLIAFLITYSTESKAQYWQSLNGPPGKGAHGIVVSSTGDLFVQSPDILHRSKDGGLSWTPIEMSPDIGVVCALGPGLLFGGLGASPIVKPKDLGVWRSLDNGNTWSVVKNKFAWSMNNVTGGRMYVTEANPTNYQVPLSPYSVSTDNGNTWKDVSPQTSGGTTNFWGDKAGHLFLATTQFLYRSTDNGDSWSKIINGLPSGSFSNFSEIIFKSMAEAPDGSLYLSASGTLNSGTEGTYHSTDGGRTWLRVSSALSGMQIAPNGRMFAGNNVSDDYGKTFRGIDLDFSANFLGMCIDSNAGLFYFNVNSTLYSSPLGIGDTIKKIPMLNSNSHVTALVSHPDRSLIAFAQDSDSWHGASIWRSTDHGIHWASVAGSTSGVCAVLDSAHDILTGSGGYIVRSTNSGVSWTQNSVTLTQGTITGIAVDKNGNIFATSSFEGVFRSSDNGITWDQLNKNITDQALYSVAVHQNGDVYVGGKNTVYRSTDHGLNWTLLTTAFPSKAGTVNPMVISTQGNVIAGIDSIGVWWSTDNGAKWSERASGFNGTKVNALISTPVGKVFAASDSGMFYLDTVDGINWIPYNNGIMLKNTLSLCRDANERLYCGTRGNGVYASIETFNVPHPLDVGSKGISQLTSLGTNFPNPVTSFARVPFTIGDQSHVTMDIVDPLGRIVSSVISGDYESGSYSASLDASKFSTGMYYLRMRTSTQNFIKPIIVAK